jgi:hypothetical protein
MILLKQFIRVILKDAEQDKKKFEPENISVSDYGSFKLKLFNKSRVIPPRWRGFLNNKILANDAVLRRSINTNHDFLLFLEYHL